MVSSGPHWEGEREREEQVHPKLYNTHSSNQRIPEGGVWKVVMGRGWKGHSESPLLLTPKHDPSPTEPKTQTDLESVQKKKIQTWRAWRNWGAGGGIKNSAGPPPKQDFPPNSQTSVSAKLATFPKSHLAFSFPLSGPIRTDLQSGMAGGGKS